MNALRNIHEALVPGALLIDAQPVSALPPVESQSGPLGTLDMREWARTIATIDRRIDETIDKGFFSLIGTDCYVVTDDYDDGQELVDVTRGWQGTIVDDAFAEHVGRELRPVRLEQTIRLRVLRAR